MYYEINVARKVKNVGIPEHYEHYFATAPRSITFYKDAVKMVKEFVKLFPSPEYEISVHSYPELFTTYSVEEFLSEFKNM